MRASLVAALLAAAFAVAPLLMAAPASAADSTATSLANPVKRATVSLGEATLTTTYTDSRVTATVAPFDLRLDPGRRYTVTVCQNVHVLTTVPAGRCVATDVNTPAGGAPQTHRIPALSSTVDRPPSGGSGYATQEVTVTDLDAAATPFASSWPAGQLAAASLPLFAVGATSGPLPGQQGITLPSTAAHGARTRACRTPCARRVPGRRPRRARTSTRRRWARCPSPTRSASRPAASPADRPRAR